MQGLLGLWRVTLTQRKSGEWVCPGHLGNNPLKRNGLWGKGSLSCLGVSGVLCFGTHACEKSLVAASVEAGGEGFMEPGVACRISQSWEKVCLCVCMFSDSVVSDFVTL